MRKPFRTLLTALWLILLGDYPYPWRTPRPDRMDRLMSEARDAGLLHGEVRRQMVAVSEQHQDLKWKSRAATPIIVMGIVVLVGLLVNAPQALLLAVMIVSALMFAVRMAVAVLHEVRWMRIEYGSMPNSEATGTMPPPISSQEVTKNNQVPKDTNVPD